MPIKEINPLKPQPNEYILDAIRNEATPDYQKRIPSATQAGIQETMKNLTRYRPHMNEFMDALVNRIGTVIVRNTSWTNPLAEFKRGLLQYGDTIEEVQMGLLKAHTYDPDREYLERDLFGTERVPVQSNFHRVNRQVFYKMTVNDALLKRAFLEPDGLSNFINDMLEAPTTSDQWDEFLTTCQLFSEYESNGGFYHVHIDDVASLESDADMAKSALRKMRGLANTLPFISTKYNAAHMPTFARPDELILFATPEFQAAIDVEALAGAFNVEKMDMYGRVVTIPADNFGIRGCQAILTTKDFFVIADQLLENTSQPNAAALHNNYFLHHWQVVSASRFVPAVMFWTGQDDEVVTIIPQVQSVETPTIEPIEGVAVTSVERGGMVAMLSRAIATPDGAAEGVLWTLTGALSPMTYISQTGVMHCAGDETAEKLTVHATATMVDPADPDGARKTASYELAVTGPTLPEWPEVADDPAPAPAP